MKTIELTRNQFAIVNDEDFEHLNQWEWYAHVKDKDPKNGYYAARRIRVGLRKENKKKTIFMHREVAQTKEGECVDHINGNGLDNRKENLRNCTNMENSRNTKGRPSKRKYSKYKGVKVVANAKYKSPSFYARITVNRREIYLGSFKTEELAALAYNDAAILHFGSFAQLNEIKYE